MYSVSSSRRWIISDGRYTEGTVWECEKCGTLYKFKDTTWNRMSPFESKSFRRQIARREKKERKAALKLAKQLAKAGD